MAKKVGFVWSPDFTKYKLADDHPLNPIRLVLTYELMKSVKLFDSGSIDILNPIPATQEQIEMVHRKDYVELVKELSEDKPEYKRMARYDYGLGPGDNPIFPYMYESSALVAGASIMAAEAVMSEHYPCAFNISGGLHHAMPAKASGFCVFNDIAIAIKYILKTKPSAKIMYIDVDAHHGDGVQEIFYNNKQVLTLSFHQDGRTLWPGTGFVTDFGVGEAEGYSVNVPLPPRAYDDVVHKAVDTVVSEVMKTFNPDYVVTQLGADMFYMDPLTQMGLSTTGMELIYKSLKKSIEKYGNNRWIALGGGGYYLSAVARAWTLALGVMAEIEVPRNIPPEWREMASKKVDEQIPYTLRDANPQVEFDMVRDPFYSMQFEDQIDPIIDTILKTIIPKIK
jgi:acetoin utilization protein AcuC